jgi:hypothetical protein
VPHAQPAPEEKQPVKAVATKAALETEVEAEAKHDKWECAMLAASYQSERNSLFGGDRQILRARLSEVGDKFREKMSAIPGCNFPIQ